MEKKHPVADYLENCLEDKQVFLWDEEIERVMKIAKRQIEHEANKGLFVDRLQHNEREQAFHDQWLKENIATRGVNYGCGTLQDLFFERTGNPMSALGSVRQIEKINERDRMIVATVIQWLGTNCGMCFLGEALERFNARIVYDTKD